MLHRIGRQILQCLPGSGDRFPSVHSVLAEGSKALHLNESPYQASRHVQDAIIKSIKNLNRYPSPQPVDLIAEIASLNGVPANTIAIGPGSDDLLLTVALTFLEAGDESIVPAPSFGKYQNATMVAGGTVVTAPISPTGEVSLSEMLECLTPRTRLVFVPSPNNPTGGCICVDALLEFMSALPERVVPVFDLAYHEYAVRSGGTDIFQALLSTKRPWICVRTLSKAYCLAGARVGYAICSDVVHQEAVLKIRSVFNVSELSIVAAVAALRDQAYLCHVVDSVVSERQSLHDALVGLGFHVLPSHANFLAVNIGDARDAVIDEMKRRGIHIAKISHANYSGYVRITVGTREENNELKETIRIVSQLFH